MPKTSSDNPSVLICAKAFPPVVGGVESYSEHVAHAYLRCGITPTVVTSFPGETGWQTRRYPEGEIEVFNVGEGNQPKTLLRLAQAVRRVLRKRAFTFCHATTWRAAVAFLPWRGRTPMAVSVHGREVLINPAYMRPLLAFTMDTADLIVSVSRYTKAIFEEKLPRVKGSAKSIVSFNGLSFRQEALAFEPAFDRETVRIYSFCRLVDRKNIDKAVRAVAALRDRHPDADFEYVIAGKGPLAGTIQGLIDRLGVGDCVRMTGYISDEEVLANFKSADVFLHPQIAAEEMADFEGFGLVIADAMSFGAVAIAGKDGGPADFIRHEETGLIVDGTNLDEIVNALEQVVLDKDKRREIGSAGRAYCLDRLSWDNHARDVMNDLQIPSK